MTIVVGYLAGKVGPSALHLAVRVARMHKTSLTVATIVRRHWPTPSLARVDAEYELWSEQLAAASAREAQRSCADWPTGSRSATTTAHTDRCRLVCSTSSRNSKPRCWCWGRFPAGGARGC